MQSSGDWERNYQLRRVAKIEPFYYRVSLCQGLGKKVSLYSICVDHQRLQNVCSQLRNMSGHMTVITWKRQLECTANKSVI
jgi:hypothetical protein